MNRRLTRQTFRLFRLLARARNRTGDGARDRNLVCVCVCSHTEMKNALPTPSTVFKIFGPIPCSRFFLHRLLRKTRASARALQRPGHRRRRRPLIAAQRPRKFPVRSQNLSRWCVIISPARLPRRVACRCEGGSALAPTSGCFDRGRHGVFTAKPRDAEDHAAGDHASARGDRECDLRHACPTCADTRVAPARASSEAVRPTSRCAVLGSFRHPKLEGGDPRRQPQTTDPPLPVPLPILNSRTL